MYRRWKTQKQVFFVEEGVPLMYVVIKVVSHNVNIQKMQRAPDVIGEGRFDNHALSSMTSLHCTKQAQAKENANDDV
ncbi:MAG: hypothetical protein EZS28_018594 [Streblomastix strix]|uniref:Uncharacterized protein n=1 Tax=Streblomastix strix TaxID=222440 RepID=A0A5J4VUN6_9EUKA|nr:MAG: hypothetical protein EZS28_018594 [Streblomastix strix]